MRPMGLVCRVCNGRILCCPHCGGPVIHTLEVEDVVHCQPTFHHCLHCARSLENAGPVRRRRVRPGRQGRL